MGDKRGLIFVCLLVVFLSSGVFAIDDLIALQGNVYNSSGGNLSTGNLVVSIYDAYSSGNLIYNSSGDFNGAISNGQYDVLLGNGSEDLTLEFGRIYYLELYVNNEAFTFNGSSRQIFQSSTGQINSSYVNANQINTAHLERNIDLVNATNIQSSAINNTGTNWAGQFLSTILDDIFDRITSVNNTGNLQNLLNSTGIYSTYNATYDANSGGNASWNQSYANSLYAPNTTAGIQSLINSTGIYSTYNATYDAKAAYQFTSNNFNGSGNFTTTGKIGVGTEDMNWSIDVRTVSPILGLLADDGSYTIFGPYQNITYLDTSPGGKFSIGEIAGYNPNLPTTEWLNFTSAGISVAQNVTASYFKGDGSLLTGISASGGGLFEDSSNKIFNSTSAGLGIGTSEVNWTIDARAVAPTLGLYDTSTGKYTTLTHYDDKSYYSVSPSGIISFGELDSYISTGAIVEWINFTSAGVGVKGNIYSTGNLTLGENLYYSGSNMYINNGTDDFMEFNNEGEIGIYFGTFISGGKDLYFESVAEDETIRFGGETGAITTTGNATASYFKGDGSLLTGISASAGSSSFATNGTNLYNNTASQFGFGISTPQYFMHLNKSMDAGLRLQIENDNPGSNAEASMKIQAEWAYGQLVATSSTYAIPNAFAILAGGDTAQMLYQISNATGFHSFQVGSLGNDILKIQADRLNLYKNLSYDASTNGGLFYITNGSDNYIEFSNEDTGSMVFNKHIYFAQSDLIIESIAEDETITLASETGLITTLGNISLADKLIYTGASLFIANSSDTFAEFSNEGSISLEQDIYLANGKDFYFESVAEDVTITLASETGAITTTGNITSMDCIIFDSGGKICSGA